MNFLIIVGATRDGRKTIHAARYLEEAITDHETEFFDLKQKEIPFLNNRTYADEGEAPEDARLLSRKIEESDGIIIVTPEYNHSIPGVLKNALDHLYPEYDGKPFSYVTTSAGGFGGVRGLSHLHDITLALGGHPGPSLNVSSIGDVFDQNGNLENPEYEDRFQEFIQESVEHTEKFS